ncbi:MAG: ATP cone domain-containing protein, partial [Thermaurantiacus sp.]
MVSGIVRRLESGGDPDIPSKRIGELVMEGLRNLDPVAYVRYASVYRDFREVADFSEFIRGEKLADEAEEDEDGAKE